MEDISFEKEIKNFFDKNNVKYEDKTASTTDIDFIYVVNNNSFSIDVKEKRQPYNMDNWSNVLEEKDCFILDELGIRKLVQCGSDSGIIIRDNLNDEYIFFNFLDLFCMPKVRVNRKTNDKGYLKGKWIINLNNGLRSKNLRDIFVAIEKYKKDKKESFNQGKCYGVYSDEEIKLGGITRTGYYKRVDYNATR